MVDNTAKQSAILLILKLVNTDMVMVIARFCTVHVFIASNTLTLFGWREHVESIVFKYIINQ
jgi:hypothetical protein